MDPHDIALAVAGIIGCGVAVMHGIFTQRFLVARLNDAAATAIPARTRGLMAGLLHFSTFNWFVGGAVLLLSAWAFGWEAKLATGLLVGSSYLFGALGNLWANRGRFHPGWILYGIALVLIAFGLSQPVA
jgi:hypothetical protein